jgi:glycosyltransferase involved in cell wall biosynthesis
MTKQKFSTGDTFRYVGDTSSILGVAEAGRRSLEVLASSGFLVQPFDKEKPRNQFGIFLSIANADLTGRLVARHMPDHHTLGHVAFWAWELEQFPKYFQPATGLVDEIWANSRFAANAISTITKTPIRVFPIPCIQTATKAKAQTRGKFKFVSVFDFNSDIERKNPIAAIMAFRAAFGKSNKVQMEIKMLNSSQHPSKLTALIEAIGTAENITFFESYFSTQDMRDWMTSADCFVSLHRSEGLGLNIMDFMALGIPTIATGYSANLEYQSSENSLLTDYDLINVSKYGPWPVNSVWAEPNVEDAARAMILVATDRILYRQLAESGLASAKSHLSKEACLGRLRTEFEIVN